MRKITVKPGETLEITAEGVDEHFVRWIGRSFYPLLEDDGERVYATALSVMVGISDVEAVKLANQYAKREGLATITVADFHKWLPATLSKLFKQEIGK